MRDRKFTRIRLQSRALVVMADNSFQALTENMSLDGVYIRTDRSIPVGNRAEITFNLPSASRSSMITIKGVVVRNDVHGFAFRFNSLDQDSFSFLKTVINRKAPYHLKPYFNA